MVLPQSRGSYYERKLRIKMQHIITEYVCITNFIIRVNCVYNKIKGDI